MSNDYIKSGNYVVILGSRSHENDIDDYIIDEYECCYYSIESYENYMMIEKHDGSVIRFNLNHYSFVEIREVKDSDA